MPSDDDNQQQDPAASLEDLEKRIRTLESENTKLKATKQGLLSDLKKKKTVDTFLKGAGIELDEQITEDDIPELLAKSLKSVASQTAAASPPAQGQQGQSGQVPSEAIDDAIKAQFNSLRKEIDTLKSERDTAQKERDNERERRRNEKLEKMVTEELRRIECRRPSHLFKLEREQFRLLDDDETVVYGSEDDPRSLRDAVTKLREDDEYSVYFPGSGATGSGLTSQKSQPSTGGNNPFATGSVNATEAARLMKDNPERGRRLMMEARVSGKLDPVLGRTFSS